MRGVEEWTDFDKQMPTLGSRLESASFGNQSLSP